MAKFNPDVPNTPDPNYLGYSKGVEQPKTDTSMGELFKGIGESFKAVVGGVDSLIKQGIDAQLEDPMRNQQTQYLSDLERTTVIAKEQGVSGTESNPSARPMEVAQIGDRLDSLQESYVSGKFKPTEYKANLWKILKEVRANNPGYVDYVDKKASEITGFNIANSYMSSLLSTLNETSNSAQSEYNKTLAYIKENLGIVGPDMLDNFEKGKVDRVTVLRTIANRKQEYENFNYNKAKMDDKNRDVSEKKVIATDYVNLRVPQIVNNAYEDVMSAAGYNGKNIEELIMNHMNGTAKLDPTTVVGLGQRFAALRPQLYQKAYNEFVKGGHVAALGSKEVNERINAGLEGYDQISKLISKEAFTAANYTAEYSKAITEKDSLNVLLHPTMGPVVREHKALEGILGTNLYSKFIEGKLAEDPQLPGKIKKFQVDIAVGAIVQPDFKSTGKPRTMQEDLAKPGAAGIKKDGAGAGLEGRTVDGIVNNINMIADRSLPEPARSNVAKYWAFDPTNFGVLDKFDMETLNPQTGRMTPGALSVWDKTTKHETAAAVFEMAKRDPEIAKRYLDWVQDGFANSLFRRSIQDLKTIQLEPGMRLTWDDKNLRLKVDTVQGGGVNPYKTSGTTARLGQMTENSATMNIDNQISAGQWQRANQSIENLNRGLAGLKSVVDASGNRVDANAYVLGLLTEFGFDPTKNVQGVPESFMRAIITAGDPPPPPPKDTKMIFDKKTGKYVPYVDPNATEGSKSQGRVK